MTKPANTHAVKVTISLPRAKHRWLMKRAKKEHHAILSRAVQGMVGDLMEAEAKGAK